MYGIGAIGLCAGVMALLLGIFLVDDSYNTDAVSTCSIVFVLVRKFGVFDFKVKLYLDFCCDFPMWTWTNSMGNGC